MQARKELVKIHELYGQTFVYVTHDQVEAMTVGQRVALMNQGQLQMVDTPYRVYNRPANLFTARFIGSPATNIMDADWNRGGLELLEVDRRSDGWTQGLRAGDIVTAVDGRPVTGAQDLSRVRQGLGPGDTVSLTYLRDGASHTVEMALVDEADLS